MPGLQDYSEFTSDIMLQLMLQSYEQEPDNSTVLARTYTDDDFTLAARWGYRPDQVQRALSVLRREVADAPIAERLKACLYALSVDSDKASNAPLFLTPEIQQAAQLQLNELLLANPILMHPLLRVHVYEQETSGVCSVAHAIAMSQRARFPMRRDGVTKEQQANWVRNRLVTWSLSCNSYEFTGLHRLASMRTPPAVLRQTRHWPTWVIASLHELSDATYKDGDALIKYTSGLLPFEPNKQSDDLATGVYTMSLIRAMGVMDGVACPELLDSFKKLGIHQWKGFTGKLLAMLPRHIFGGMDGAVVHGAIAERTRLILQGLIDSGFADNPREATEYVSESIAMRPALQRPLSSAEIIDVLRELKAAGAPFLQGQAFGAAGSTAEWVVAAESVEREDAMRKVIGTPNTLPNDVDTPRRRRAGL